MLQKLNTSMHKKIALILLTAVASQACADEGHSPSGAQSHAPIGVMGDHIHKKGEFMFSYRFMQMGMEANRNRGDDLRPEEVIRFENTFAGRPMQPPLLRVVPLEMTMDMHMFGAMYAPSDKLTLMLMTNYLEKTMDHVTFNGNGEPLGFFTTETDGIGDTSLSALINWADNVHATVGVSLPTGSIEETGEILTPMGQTPTVRLPYPMQLGSGTYDVIIGLTAVGQHKLWNFGTQWRSEIRTGENDEGYTLGNEHKLTSWISYALNDSLSVSGRLAFLLRGNISGQDETIVAPVQTADPKRQRAERVDFLAGLNWLLPDKKNRLALEVGAPVYQYLDGPQLETDTLLTLGWQLAF